MAAIDKYSVTVDWITFIFILYNFAVVGVIAIFYKKGTPSYVGQGYLVIVSLTIAYLLSFLPEWTGWYVLCVCVYDDSFIYNTTFFYQGSARDVSFL